MSSSNALQTRTVASFPQGFASRTRLVVAHFMLGNTYPFTEQDWRTSISIAEHTGLDGFALNLGFEDWQIAQARTAYTIAGSSKIRLFLSLDMNVLPCKTPDDGDELREKVLKVIQSDAQMKWDGRPILSTFGGHAAEFGGDGWVFFIPAFFMPPYDFIALPHVDGTFAWNNAWPMEDRSTDLREDLPFLDSVCTPVNLSSVPLTEVQSKPYMAAVSPLFFTHYGTTGQWAFDKNWIYRSDDLLYPTRWSNVLSLPPSRSPSIIQVISWNDYGESHYIAPILGAQPGSERWTGGMPHEAVREMTRYFAAIWRDQGDEVEENRLRVWMWYRTHPAGLRAEGDEIGRPGNADWARDLINLFILVPLSKAIFTLLVNNGEAHHSVPLATGKSNAMTVPFQPGSVQIQLLAKDQVILDKKGRSIEARADEYNFNIWTGSWSVDIKL